MASRMAKSLAQELVEIAEEAQRRLQDSSKEDAMRYYSTSAQPYLRKCASEGKREATLTLVGDMEPVTRSAVRRLLEADGFQVKLSAGYLEVKW